MLMNNAGAQIRNIEILIRSHYPIIYVISSEEKRVVKAAASIGQRLNRNVFVWSCLSGLTPYSGPGEPVGAERTLEMELNPGAENPVVALREAMDYTQPGLFILKDFHPYLNPDKLDVLRSLREIAQDFPRKSKTIILTGPVLNLPPDLEKDVTVIDFPLPGPREIGALLDRTAKEAETNPKLSVDLSPEAREEIIKAANGLTMAEAENVFTKSLVVNARLGLEQIPEILAEKRQIIRKSGLLDFYDSEFGLDDVGGLDNLKKWLKKRKQAFSDRALDFGLPAPRGVLILGVQGCGKSMCSKAISVLWNLPLLRLDIGRIFDSKVGGSEGNIRRAIKIAEGVAPCILWIDEIDKAFGGQGGADSGISQRVLGTLLTWLAEKSSSVFVAATANNISFLPPELLRKGRFDEIFFVDLPNARERESILSIHLGRRQRDPGGFDLPSLVQAMDGFSGAEIEQAVVSALFDAFYDNGREITSQDILVAISETVPLSQTMLEEIQAIRQWCRSRARGASEAGLGSGRINRL
ncbi:AAA family ATPase [Deltaproteobacteria bacterium OttesenSCG-928-K17]|nr:AAA family ATPase [Deltaproteobacteria bacterium OttesenSCG-928-K17]